MRYIQLSNDSYILHLSTGIKTITTRSFNFHKIKKLVQKGASEEELLPLLTIPPLPNGLFEAYIVNSTQKMIYTHITKDNEQYLKDLQSGDCVLYSKEEKEKEKDLNFVGVYASLEDLMEDWPEFLL